MLAEGVPPHLAALRVSKQFGVGLRQGQKYVERAFQRWSELEIEERSDRKTLMRRKILAVFQKCYLEKEWGQAIKALDLLGKLDGLFERSKPGEHVGETTTESRFRAIQAMGPHARRARIQELITRAIQAEPEFAATARSALDSLSK